MAGEEKEEVSSSSPSSRPPDHRPFLPSSHPASVFIELQALTVGPKDPTLLYIGVFISVRGLTVEGGGREKEEGNEGC